MLPTEGGLRCPCPLRSQLHPRAVTGKAPKRHPPPPPVSLCLGSRRKQTGSSGRGNPGLGGGAVCGAQHWFSWPRIFGSRGSYGSCQPSAP